MYISIIVTSGLGRAVVPWSILEIADEQKSFEDLFWSVQAGCFDVIPVSDELKRAQLIKTSVGTKADSLMIVSSSQTVCSVCEQFGKYVKLTVEITPMPPTEKEPVMLPNAFTVMMAAQQRLQHGDGGLPFQRPVKDARERMFNDLIDLLREMEVYGLDTTEEHRPSLLTARKTALQSLGFTPSQQHVRNVGVLIQCDECGMWRLLFSKQKLNYQELSELERSLDDVSYSCGLSLSELDLPSRLKGVGVKDHRCNDPTEKLYYSCDFEPICYWCASENVPESTEYFPVCVGCEVKPWSTGPRRRGNSDHY